MQASERVKTPLERLLLERIAARGPIPFAEFMEACLYHPLYGYYSRAHPERPQGDYYTSPEVHPIFGRLLARQLREMWERMGRPAAFTVLELGAGEGRLAEDILHWVERQGDEFASAFRYVALEISAARRATLEHTLAGHKAQVIERLSELAPIEGCVLSNEFMDALPVHLVVRERGRLREVYVGSEGGELAESLDRASRKGIEAYFEKQEVRLVEGQRAEVNLKALEWMAEIAHVLERGFVLTIDYGYRAQELYHPSRYRGTLLAYRGHRASERYLESPGEQDLTAHVNFTALINAGGAAGLDLSGFTTQGKFLMALGRENEFADLYEGEESESEHLKARLLLKNLIYPEGMGETFKILIQQKGLGRVELTGLAPL